jgi:hypothetical protein
VAVVVVQAVVVVEMVAEAAEEAASAAPRAVPSTATAPTRRAATRSRGVTGRSAVPLRGVLGARRSVPTVDRRRKNMKRDVKRLPIRRETIRALQNAKLANVVGGTAFVESTDVSHCGPSGHTVCDCPPPPL